MEPDAIEGLTCYEQPALEHSWSTFITMTRRDAAVLTLRAFAMYAWFQAIEFFASGAMGAILVTFANAGGGYSLASGAAVFGPAVIYLAVGAFLFVRSQALAAWLMPPASETAPGEELPPNPLPFASVAFAVIGLAFVLYAVPGVIGYGILFANANTPGMRALQWSTELPHIIGKLAQVGLGFLLFVNARTFATAWWRKQQPNGTQ